MKANYHAHTPRCQHAQGTEEEYVLAAIENGYQILGFSDHTPISYENDFVSFMRMRPDQLPGYVRAVREAGKRHEGEIRVYCGLECENFPRYLPWILEKKEELGLDYLLLGNHYDQTDQGGFYFGSCKDRAHMRRYLDSTISGLQTGAFLYLAHPDVFLAGYAEFDADCVEMSRELCRAAKALRIPLEYNLLGRLYTDQSRFEGRLGYPVNRFWEIAAEEGAQCCIGVDAHAPRQLADNRYFEAADVYLRTLGMNRIESFEICGGK